MKKQILALIMAVAMVFSTPMPVMASESSDDVIETPVDETEATSEEPEESSTEADSKDNTNVESNEAEEESESVEEEALEEELLVEEDEEEELLEESEEEEVTDPDVTVTYQGTSKKFKTYYEAVSYIDTLEESDSVCEILLNKDISEASAGYDYIIPNKNIPLLIKGDGGVKKLNTFNRVELHSDTEFENITLVPADTNQAYGINMNGHNFTVSKGGDYSKEDLFDLGSKGTSIYYDLSGGTFYTKDADFTFLEVGVDKAYIEEGHTLTADKKAYIKQLMGKKNPSNDTAGPATIKGYKGTELKLTNILTEDSQPVQIGRIDADGNLIEMPNGTVAFITAGPTDWEKNQFTLLQPEGSEASNKAYYDTSYYNYQYIVGEHPPIILEASTEAGPDVRLDQNAFSDWNSMITYINSLGDVNYRYMVEVYGDVVATGTNIFPDKAAWFSVYTLNNAGTITIDGDGILPCEVYFQHVDTKIGENCSKLNLGDNRITFDKASAVLDFSKVDITSNYDFNSGNNCMAHIQLGAEAVFGAINVNSMSVSCPQITIKVVPGKKAIIGSISGNYSNNAPGINEYYDTYVNVEEGVELYSLAIHSSSFSGESIHYRRVDKNGKLLEIKKGDTLFYNKGRTKDFEGLVIDQPEGGDTKLIPCLSGENIVADKLTVRLDSYNIEPEDYHHTEYFPTWKDAVAKADLLYSYSKDFTFAITIEEDTALDKLTLPKAPVTIVGNDKTKLSFGGDLAPATDVTFQNIVLESTKSGAKMNAGAHQLKFQNVKFNNIFASVSATGKGKITVVGGADSRAALESTGAINVSNLTLVFADVTSTTGSINVSNLAELSGSKIDVKTAATFKNINSMDDSNTITYGTSYSNKLSITGVVNADVASKDITAKTTGEKPYDVKISEYAINVLPKFLTANDYASADTYLKKDIVFAKQAPACYFVIGKNIAGASTTIKYATKKVANALRIDTAPIVYAVEVFETSDQGNCSWGTFATLKEAFAEIDKSGSIAKNYIVAINPTVQQDVEPIKLTDNLTTATKAAQITIKPADGVSGKYELKLKNAITLKSNLVLENIKLADNPAKNGTNTKLNATLGKFKLTLKNSEVSNDRIGNITGSGVNAASGFIVRNSGDIVVNGNMNNVGTLDFENGKFTVYGKTNIGNLVSKDSTRRTFVGTAQVATAKVKGQVVATKITSNITVANKIEAEDISIAPSLEIKLLYKDKKKGYVELGSNDVTFEGFKDGTLAHNNPKYQIVKAPKAANNRFVYTDSSVAGGKLVKKSGSIFYVDNTTVEENYGLYEAAGEDATKTAVELASFATYKEAIAEINAIKNPNGIYIIVPLKSDNKPENLVMPAANCADKLILSANPARPTDNTFSITNTSLNLTSDLMFGGITVKASKPVAINVGQHTLAITSVNWDNSIKSITGAGENFVNKKTGAMSRVMIEGSTINVDGNVTKLHDLGLSNSATLNGHGKVSVGTIYNNGAGNTITAPCTYTTEKDKKTVKAVKTNITVVNGFENSGNPVNFKLVCKEKSGQYTELTQLEKNGTIDLSKVVASATPAFEIIKTTTAAVEDASGVPSFNLVLNSTVASKAADVVRKNGVLYYNTAVFSKVPGYELSVLSHEGDIINLVGRYATYNDAITDINNKLPMAEYSLKANAESGSLQHPVEIYNMPKANKAPKFTLTADKATNLKYNGNKGMTIKVDKNQRVYIVNINFVSEGKGKKPVNISLGNGSSQYNSFDSSIDNLKNITGSANSTVSFSSSKGESQYYTGTVSKNINMYGYISKKN
ncbi:hypothetical protein SAMN04487830_11620 [Pseudobutyrivibrio sp. OR37]|uniref:hypothetical protein n=1 Tax=Pseudobutyrivibrio sp. OR37 TaxID=1798186 RepID=UPI0008F307B5|nr:hypothetical protein [Pseudobutyrivibrio sp. OR37]SFH99040.1 hypothetical protein SAMN04487830_11620 [Pseudobutyrivibrio sp. OR37]